MVCYSVPHKNGFHDFNVEPVVMFAGSRHGILPCKITETLVLALAKEGFSFLTGCAKGIDFSFRKALSRLNMHKVSFVACALVGRADLRNTLGLPASMVVKEFLPPKIALHNRTVYLVKRTSVAIVFPDNPFSNVWGNGSKLVIRECIKSGKPVFVVSDKMLEESKEYKILPSSLYGIISGYWVLSKLKCQGVKHEHNY
jgi:hypothetical protein